MKHISFESQATVKRALTNQSIDPSSTKPFLASILGPERYQELLKLDATPLVLEMNSIATAENGPLSFQPKYDVEISRNEWKRVEDAWIAVAYTDKHSPRKAGETAPITRGRVLKTELKNDGWYTYVYILPSHDGYKADVQAEATLFPGRMVRSVSTEFLLNMKDGVIKDFEPKLIAEVPSPNVMGSGVTGLFNQKKESDMEKQDIINALKAEDLKGSNVLVILEKEHREDARKTLLNDPAFRQEVLGKLTDDEKKALVNGLSKEMVSACDTMLERAQVILNEKAEGQKAKDAKFRKDVMDMFKAVTNTELKEEEAGYLILANGWKPGEETAVKKYIEFHNQLKVGNDSYFAHVIQNQRLATTQVDDKRKDKKPEEKKATTAFGSVVNGVLEMLPGGKKKTGQ